MVRCVATARSRERSGVQYLRSNQQMILNDKCQFNKNLHAWIIHAKKITAVLHKLINKGALSNRDVLNIFFTQYRNRWHKELQRPGGALVPVGRVPSHLLRAVGMVPHRAQAVSALNHSPECWPFPKTQKISRIPFLFYPFIMVMNMKIESQFWSRYLILCHCARFSPLLLSKP